MPIELGTLRLSRIHSVQTLEEASLVYHDVLGLEGSAVQDLGRTSVRLQIQGIFYGDSAQEQLEELRSIHINREPVDFVAAATGGNNYVGKVTLDRFEVAERAGETSQFSYTLILSEYVAPPKKSSGLKSLIEIIKQEAFEKKIMLSLPEALTAGALPEISNPFGSIKNVLDGVKQAMSGFETAAQGAKKVFGIEDSSKN